MDKNVIKTALLHAFPIALAIATYSFSCGILAREASFTLFETFLMSVFVFSGSVQLTTSAMIIRNASILTILVAVFLMNLRNILYGMALSKNLGTNKWVRRLLAHGISDEPFVLGSGYFRSYGPNPLYYGTIVTIFYFSWVTASVFGYLLSTNINSTQWGLDFAFPASFAALMIASLIDKPAVLCAVLSFVIAGSFETFAPGNSFTLIATGILAPILTIIITSKRKSSHE